jgi:hypothetical protein
MAALELGGLHMTRRSTEGSSTPKVRGRNGRYLCAKPVSADCLEQPVQITAHQPVKINGMLVGERQDCIGAAIQSALAISASDSPRSLAISLMRIRVPRLQGFSFFAADMIHHPHVGG